MEKEIIHTTIPSQIVNGFTHEQFQGISVEQPNSPFMRGHIPHFSRVRVPESSDTQSLTRIGIIHKRAYEVKTGENPTIVWQDEFGNIYTKINLKGNNLILPKIHKYSISPSGFLFYGLQDTNSIVRTLKVSHLLRSHNIDCEIIEKAIEPLELPINGELKPLGDFKKQLILNTYNDDNEEGKIDEFTGFELAARKDIEKASEAIKDENLTLVITVRGLQVSERLRDINTCESEEDFKRIVSSAFYYINLTEAAKAVKDPGHKPRFFDTENNADLNEYFSQYLPQRIAENYFKLHSLGLIHVYSQNHNISTVGSIVDLDSVKGEVLELGDKPITTEQKAKDVSNIVSAEIAEKEDTFDGALTKYIEGYQHDFNINLAKHYIHLQGWDQGKFEDLKYITTIIGNGSPELQVQLLDFYKDKFTELSNLRLDLNFPNMLIKLSALPTEADTEEDEEINAEHLLLLLLASENIAVEVYKAENVLNNPQLDEDTIEMIVKAYLRKSIIDYPKAEDPEKLEQYFFAAGVVSQKIGTAETTEILFRILTDELAWDKNIMKYLPLLHESFEPSKRSPELFNYYHNLLINELGWDYKYEKNEETLLYEFCRKDQEDLARAIPDTLANSEKNIEQLFDESLSENSLEMDFSYDHDGRHNSFIITAIEKAFSEDKKAQLMDISEKYGQETADAVIYFYTYPYIRQFVDNKTDEVREEIQRKCESYIAEHKQKILHQTTQ